MSNSIKSMLVLEKVVFDRIEFKRIGFKSDKELDVEIECNISQKLDSEVYRVTLVLTGNKPDEYCLEISISGYFSFDATENLTDELKSTLINKNTIAILMPYLRSEVSLLTAQPDMECVVLPAFNVNKMLSSKDKE